MGQLYSHLVFRPPKIVSYQCIDGQLRYIYPDFENIPRVHSTPIIWLRNALNVRIPCVWIRNPKAQYVILYAHQNAEDLGTSIQHAHALSVQLGVDVFAFEYTGYGLSRRDPKASDTSRKVAPSERAVCCDIDAAYDYLTQVSGVDPMKIVVVGRSIGSGPAVYLSTRRKVGGLILIAPIASAVRVALKGLNVTIPFVDTFPNIDRAAMIRCPVLVIHGDKDDIVPKIHGQRLFEKIRHFGIAVNPLWVPNAQHNNVVEDFDALVFGRYSQFFDELKTLSLEILPENSRPVRKPSKYEEHLLNIHRKQQIRRTLMFWKYLPDFSFGPKQKLQYEDELDNEASRARRMQSGKLHRLKSQDSVDRVFSFHDSLGTAPSFCSRTSSFYVQKRKLCGFPKAVLRAVLGH